MIVNGHSDFALHVYRERVIHSREDIYTNYVEKLKKGQINLEIVQVGCDFLNWQGIDWNNPQII